MKILSEYYDPGRLRMGIGYFFNDPFDYVFDSDRLWLETWKGYTVEIGPIFWILVLFAICYSIYSFTRNKNSNPDYSNNKVFLWLVITFSCYCFLQLRISEPIFTIFPFLDFIQFPWRLNVFIQISGLLLIGSLKFKYNRFISVLALSVFILSYPFLQKTSDKWEWYTAEQVEDRLNTGVFGQGEYIPDVEPKENITRAFFKEMYLEGAFLQRLESGSVSEVETKNPEDLEIIYDIKITAKSILVLPHNYSGLEEVHVRIDDKLYELEAKRTKEDPRIQITISKGHYQLILSLPRWRNLI